ncbi:hypothetical protein MBLNU230_g2157t1 [Neophaeotheca triangularis]
MPDGLDRQREAVAFLGPKASYTHQATRQRFPEANHTLSPQTTIEDIFASVQSQTTNYGVVPFENSSNGCVVFTLDLLADRTDKYPDALVCGEIYLPVQHCLVGRRRPRPATSTSTPTSTPTSNAKEGDFSYIRKLYSHPQAWGQCTKFLQSQLKHAERQDVSSTSKGCELVAMETGNETTAAISSKMAAELYDVPVLVEGIEDHPGENSTRFFVLRNRGVSVPGAGLAAEREEKRRHKSLVTFTVPHISPGSLADALSVFKKHGLNLTSINTRPSGEETWHYVFFVEFVGRREEGGEGGVNEALRELDGVVQGWRWLGSWVDAQSGGS